MALIKWSEERHMLGIGEVDSQHRRLIDVVNGLQAALSEGQAKEVVCNFLSVMEEYSRNHFSYEEELMLSLGYHGYSAKKREHESFLRQLETLSREYRLGNMTVSMNTLNFLKDWLDHHIVNEDREYSPYTQHHGKGVA
ncbi:hypothetical protein MNBD_DELTA02-207 [hydrothermal vent metagenome]|uniref:Hemerythrin-like domain-containing protein n=1 Tax=hydrothermal vent metagenome TaxID=652676 RepID=A0A3B0UV59_9ZZZZ